MSTIFSSVLPAVTVAVLAAGVMPMQVSAAGYRSVPGVACPPSAAIRNAVDSRRLVLCMTPAEVDAAQPFDAERLIVHSRLLPVGPSVVEWVYDPDIEGWPAVVRFDNNHVIGYTNALPDYYRERWAELRDSD